MKRLALSAVLAVLPFALVSGAPTADAKIACKNGYQMVQGGPLATPYCQDNLVAEVARSRGIRVSDAEIRSNPNTKRHVCLMVGPDIRIQQACIDAYAGRRGF